MQVKLKTVDERHNGELEDMRAELELLRGDKIRLALERNNAFRQLETEQHDFMASKSL